MDGDIHITAVEPRIDKISLYTLSTCTHDDDKYKLECTECHRLVHYRCTQLPAYQIQLFLIKGYRKYMGATCVVVPVYLREIVPRAQAPSSHTKTITELTTALNESAVENETLLVNHLALTNKFNQLRTELEKEIESSKKHKEELAQLQSEITEYDSSTKTHEESEVKLRTIIANQKHELVEQQEKFDHVGNPDYDALTKREDMMKNKLEEVGKTLKESLLREVRDNNKKIEEKMNEMMSENRSYAETVKNIKPSENCASKPDQNTDFRAIMMEARNDELADESDKKLRSSNIILHGVLEATTNDKDENKKMDEAYVTQFIDALEIKAPYKSVFRIGKADSAKKRHIKVIINSEEDKKKIMANLKKLKNQATFKGLSVTDDYTSAERRMLKEWLDKAKENNDNASPDSEYIWRVRGTPKNGLRLKKLLKRKPLVVLHL